MARKWKMGWVLFIVMMLVVTACSSNKDANKDANNDAKPSESVQASQPPATESGASAHDKTFEVTFERFSINAFEPPADNVIERMIKDDLNVNLKLAIGVGNYANWAQQFSTRVAANDLPDIVFLNKADVAKFAKNGTIIPLDDLLDKYPDFKGRLDEQAWKLSSVDQKIYGVPNLNPEGPYTANYIRKDWLDKLGLEMPKTAEEFRSVLQAFTEGDPDGNGQKDTFGYTVDDPNFAIMSTLTNIFGVPQFGTAEYGIPMDWIDSSKQLHFGPISDEYKAYLGYMHQLMADKVIDPDIASNTFAIFKQKMAQGKAGVVSMFLPQLKMFENNTWLKQIKEVSPQAEWVYLPPIQGPNGDKGNNATSPDASYFTALTKKVLEEPGKAERAIELLDYMFRDGYDGKAGGQFIDFGVEGVHHKKEGGKITEILPQYNADVEKYLNMYTMGGVPNSPEVLKIISSEKDYSTFEQMDADRSKGDLITNYYYQALPFAYDGNNYIQEMSLKFIYGREDLSKWDDYVKTLNERYKYAEVQKLRTQELKDLGFLP